MLNLYQAELARILRLQCADIGQLGNEQAVLESDTEALVQVLKFLQFYRQMTIMASMVWPCATGYAVPIAFFNRHHIWCWSMKNGCIN